MRIKAATIALFPAQLYTRSLLQFKIQNVHHNQGWDRLLPLPQNCLDELTWWHQNLTKWNGRSLLPLTPQHTMYVDASDYRWGGVYHQQVVQGHWTTQERAQSINWRELKAIHLILQSFPHLTNTTILIRTDNMMAKSYINRYGGTRSLLLNVIATTIWEQCKHCNLWIQAQHIAGIDNVQADHASRFSPSTITRFLEEGTQGSQGRSYHRGQDLFIHWGRHYNIDLNQFSVVQLIEFLQLAADSGFAPNMVGLFRWAVTAFHINSSTLSSSPELHQCLSRLKKKAPPLPLSKSPVDLTPSFTFLRSIPSHLSTSLNLLSKKCAFLLAAAAFLQPSDLHRISLSACSIDDSSRLHLIIVVPKETRNGRHIYKDLMLLPLTDDVDLCPI
ncbi:hypothetical protein INT45_013103 [Circinella minor]|uniref:Reverse transcriptase RNase H-like domain-containing protein n=1 Tax=Circinella minor TaxID=1195481 RepID=A0A8H7RTV8_9FUNG|nr:hypothetical protein INT45_013103 [Circinella minor]